MPISEPAGVCSNPESIMTDVDRSTDERREAPRDGVRSYRFELTALCMTFMVAFAVGYVHVFDTIDLPFAAERLVLHDQILSSAAASPYQYRVLVPYLVEAIRNVVLLWGPNPSAALLIAYRLFDLIAVWISLLAMFYYFRRFFARNIALAAALFVGGIMVIPLRNHFYQPWSLLEPGIVALGLLLLHRRRHGLFLILVVVATLTRETAGMLVFAQLGALLLELKEAGWNNRGVLRESGAWLAASLALWLAVFVGLRLARGSAVPVETVATVWELNTSAGSHLMAIARIAGFLGPFWLLVLLGWRSAPAFVRWTALMVPFYVAALLPFGAWGETRLLMVLYPVLIPIGIGWMSACDSLPPGSPDC